MKNAAIGEELYVVVVLGAVRFFSNMDNDERKVPIGTKFCFTTGEEVFTHLGRNYSNEAGVVCPYLSEYILIITELPV